MWTAPWKSTLDVPSAPCLRSDEQRRKILKDAGLKDGSFAATDVGVDIELKRWGTRETILRKT